MDKTMKQGLKTLVWPLCFAALLAAGAVAAKTPAQYSFAVVPQFGAPELHKDWTPLLQRIERETGITLLLKISASIENFETDVTAGGPDFAYVDPYLAVAAWKAQAYIPLLRDKTPLTGMLLARRDGPYQSVRDLNGQVLGFPSPNAFGASLYLRALLAENAKIKFEARYLATHSNVLRNVVRNSVAAGGSVSAAFRDETPELREQLRVIYRTPEVAPHPIVAHPRVPAAVRQAVLQAMLGLSADAAGRALLGNIRTPEPVPANYERDYLPLEQLKLQKYLVKTSD